MDLTLTLRREVIKKFRKKYKKAPKKEKSVIFDTVIDVTGYNRHYAAGLLRQSKYPHTRKKRKGTKKYTEDIERMVMKIWYTYDMICGKRFAPYMAEGVAALERAGEIVITEEQRILLTSISSATLDRMIKKERTRKKIYTKGRTKPGTLLKNSIPIRTYAEWDENHAGFVEIDLVAHDGGDISGEYNNTLTVTDIKTCWTEIRAVRNKAETWVFQALKDIRHSLPFALKGIDSDNGSEFINHHLLRYCKSEEITFTRSRAYRKNDSCYVEQKNWSVVRRHVGYTRFDTEETCVLLNRLYVYVNLYVNFFQPVMKCIMKERDGGKTRKIYDTACTPYARVLKDKDIEEAEKENLKEIYLELNPVKIKKTITRLQNQLLTLAGSNKK